ncbi:hypothetical protein Mapa_009039 [Marchantia paleacea]|nr:hypothetical protein Mapa_009039 [Marchantia paleacea]
MDTKLATTVFMGSAVLMILMFVMEAAAEDFHLHEGESTSASLARRSLLNLRPQRKTCKLNKAMCSEPGSAGPNCCNELCVNTSTDINHCGHCDHSCYFGRTCCDGDCVDLETDEDNCGRCGLKCPRIYSTSNFHRSCENGLCNYN